MVPYIPNINSSYKLHPHTALALLKGGMQLESGGSGGGSCLAHAGNS